MLDGNTLYCKSCGKASDFEKFESHEKQRLRCLICGYEISTQNEVDLARQIYKTENRAKSATAGVVLISFYLTVDFWVEGAFFPGLMVAGLGAFICYLVNDVAKTR